MEPDAKICLICGINANKQARYDRYNIPPIRKNKAKEVSSSESDSDDNTASSKSKKKAPPPRAPVGGGSTRQTRNQNPKSFAASLCKAMDLPPTPDQPFLQIFSRADYCNDCMAKVKDIHSSQSELEKIQKRLNEYKVDIELDMSKHLQKIPFCKNILRTDVYSRYREDLDLILDFHGTDKNKNSLDGDDEESIVPASKRQKRQAAIDSSEKMKRKLEEEEVALREDKKEKRVAPIKISKYEKDGEFVLEESTSGEVQEDRSEETNGVCAEVKLEEPAEGEGLVEAGADGNGTGAEETAPIIVPVKGKVKKDPNLKCPHCPIPRYFNIPESLEEHVIRAHLEKKKHVCDICENRFHSVKELQNHKKKIHDVSGGDEAVVGWTCGFCDQEFAQKRYLEDHLDRHEEAKPLNCMYCGGSFPRKESLQRAFQIYKGEAVDPCKKCGRNLNLKDYLEHNRRVKENK